MPHTLTAQEFSNIANNKRRLLGIAVAIIEIYNGGVTREKENMNSNCYHRKHYADAQQYVLVHSQLLDHQLS